MSEQKCRYCNGKLQRTIVGYICMECGQGIDADWVTEVDVENTEEDTETIEAMEYYFAEEWKIEKRIIIILICVFTLAGLIGVFNLLTGIFTN